MDINIQNYNGIKSLNYEIIDGKVNFLFGISGSGKSSIASALSDNELESHVTVGKRLSDMIVTVNGGNVDYDYFKTFNLNYMQDVLITKKNGSDIYSILLGDGGRIAEFKNNYETAIADLNTMKDEIINAISKISILVKELKLSIVSEGKKFSSTSLNVKMAKNVQSIANYSNINRYNTAEIKWIKDGTNMSAYSIGNCPFCTRKMSEKRKNIIDKIIIFDSKSYEKINSQSTVLASLGLTVPDWKKKRDVAAFNKKLLMYCQVKSELEKFNSYIDVASSMEIQDINISFEKPSSQLKNLYPNIADAVLSFNSKMTTIKQSLGKLKSETQKVISKNCKAINEKLDLLGIPYEFTKSSMDENSKTAAYNICHKQDLEKDIDRVKNLSFGEKNLIGLLLFLIANEESSGLIIDDPASSFDDYRRKVIFDMIYDLHKTSTVLVLSHDSTFAKYAVFHKKDSEEMINKKKSISQLKKKFYYDTGKIEYMETYSDSFIMPITFEDFGSLSSFVVKRLQSLENSINYRTAINIRLLFELNKYTDKDVYGYLSAIIHRTEYETIQNYLLDSGISESDVLEKIKNKCEIDYSPLSPSYVSEIDTLEYLDFEKVFKCRELLSSKKKSDKVLKDELSNIIHMNSAQAICLNPYKFNYFSKYVKNYIDNN